MVERDVGRDIKGKNWDSLRGFIRVRTDMTYEMYMKKSCNEKLRITVKLS